MIIAREISSQDESNGVPSVKEILFLHKILPVDLQCFFFKMAEGNSAGVAEVFFNHLRLK